jgi:hypothetical protein
MLLKGQAVKTEFGTIETIVAHCDYCGSKHLVGGDIVKGGAMNWLEVRRFDRDVPPIHFCCLGHLVDGIQRLMHSGVDRLEAKNWERILDVCSTAVGES